MDNNQKTYTFNVNGMHCNACVFLTENELREHPRVSYVKTSLKTRTVDVRGDFGDALPEEVMKELAGLLSQHTLSNFAPVQKIEWKEFALALPIALGFILFFIVLQKAGIVHLINAEQVSYGTVFLIGIIASLSTCMAVVGGLVLSMSAAFAKQGDAARPQALFHIGRLVSFFVLGGVIGAVGASFQLGTVGTGILGIGIGLVMFVLGLNLLDLFSWSKRLLPSMPTIVSQRAIQLTKVNHRLTPVLIGIVSFFLPCGFTQSMQIYALGTGSFLKGALTMLVFALGTLPVLALVSFSSFSIKNSSRSGIFFKSAGLIVILFAIFNIINSMAAIGLIQPVFNF